MALTFRKLHRHFVAEVSPVDLRQVHDRETLAQIRAGMDEYAVLVFHYPAQRTVVSAIGGTTCRT